MRTEHLKYFLALANNHSITKTSQEFYTTHQSVSKIIRQLEDDFGSPLFERSQKGMALTPQGEMLLPIARETVQAFQELRIRMDQLNRAQDLEGTLSIYGSPIANSTCIAELMKDFSVRYPKVRYLINEANVLDILQTVALHRSAIGVSAILNNPMFRNIYDPYLHQVHIETLFKDEYLCIVGAKCPLVHEKSVSLNEFAAYPIAILTADDTDNQPLIQLFKQHFNIEPALVTRSTHLYVQSIASGRYVGVSSKRMYELNLTSYFSSTIRDNGGLYLPFKDDMSIDIALVTNLHADFDDIEQAFVDMVRTSIKENKLAV